MKQFNLIYEVGMVMTNYEWQIPLLIIQNGIIDSLLPFMCSEQWYFVSH